MGQRDKHVAIFSPTWSDPRLKCSLEDKKYTHLSREPVSFEPVTFQDGSGVGRVKKLVLLWSYEPGSLEGKRLKVNTQILAI